MSPQTPTENRHKGPLGVRWSPEMMGSISFAVGVLLIARLGLWVPLPGVDVQELTRALTASGAGLFPHTPSVSMAQVSVFALGLWPFVYAWAICELFRGRTPHDAYARWQRLLTLLIAIGMSMRVASEMTATSNLIIDPGPMFQISTILTLTAGTMLLFWLGEQITKTGLCNGIWLIIAVDVISGILGGVWMMWNLVSWGALGPGMAIVVAVLLLATVCLVVFVECAKRIVKRKTYVPVDFATILPAVFAGLLLFGATTGFAYLYPWLGNTAYLGLIYLGPGQPMYLFSYAVLIVVMTFFLAALIKPRYVVSGTKPDGQRKPAKAEIPHRGTQDHFLNRLTIITSMYLLIVFLLPELILKFAAAPLPISGTSMLIVFVVMLDILNRAGAKWGR